MADKFHSDTQEKVEFITYSPGIQDSGDLEAGTKTITATSKQGTPDYSTSLTTAAPGDGRLVVKVLCARLLLLIDSMTAGHLYGALHVNGVERKTFDFTSTGANLTAVNLSGGQFNVGAANTLEVFLWVDSGNAVISLAQLWQGVGSCTTPWYDSLDCLELNFTGMFTVVGYLGRLGTGTPQIGMYSLGTNFASRFFNVAGEWATFTPVTAFCKPGLSWKVGGSVATDLNYPAEVVVLLRTEA